MKSTDEPSTPEPTDEDLLPAGYVALIGRPNTGKSTLMNMILGVDLAITTAKPQTTRNQILGVRTFEDGQLCFVDTPGIHVPTRGLNHRMNNLATHALDGIDAICHVVDASKLIVDGNLRLEPFKEGERLVYRSLEHAEAPVNLILNKTDKIKNKALLLPILETLNSYYDYAEVIPLSALKGDNVPVLIQVLLGQVPKQGLLFPEDMLTDKAERFIAAEFVRQAIMEQTHNEIPYSVAVEIETFKEGNRCLEVSAVIHLERQTQKPIVIGKGGERIKQIGIQSRRAMEQFFGRKVFLETFVRIENQWSDNPVALDRFGYGDNQ